MFSFFKKREPSKTDERRLQRATFYCAKCNQKLEIEYFDSYIAEPPFSEKNDILKKGGTYKTIVCPHCGNKIIAAHPYRYTDKNEGYDIFLLPENSGNNEIANVNKTFFQTQIANNNYHLSRRRSVSTWGELAEKIGILDAKIDDRAIEVAKVLSWNELIENGQFEANDYELCYFSIHADNTALQPGGYVLTYSFTDNQGKHQVEMISLPKSYVNGIAKSLANEMNEVGMDEYGYVDKLWAYEVIALRMKHMEQEEHAASNSPEGDIISEKKQPEAQSHGNIVDVSSSLVPGKTFNYAFSCSVLKELFYSDIVFAENILESQSISKLIATSLWVCDTKMELNVPDEYRHLKKHFINNSNDNISGIIIELPDAKAECDCNFVALVVSDGEKEYYTSEYYKSANAFGLCFFDENDEHYALDANIESLEDFKKGVFKC